MHPKVEGFAWTSWQSLGGVVRSNPAVGVNVNGSLVVFALQTDFALYFNEQKTTKLIAQNWIVNGNNWWGVLNIPSVAANGKFNGTIYGNPLNGSWTASSRQITFERTVSPPDYLQNWLGSLSYSLEGAFTEKTNGIPRQGFYPWQAWQSVKVTFRTSNGQFLSVEFGAGRVVANGSSVNELAKFELIALGDNKIAIKSLSENFRSVKILVKTPFQHLQNNELHRH